MHATKNMDRHKNVFLNEKYSNDVTEEVLNNLKKKYLQRQEMYIWGSPGTFLNFENIVDSIQTEKEEIHEKVLKKENVSSSIQAITKGDTEELHCGMRIPLNHENDQFFKDNRRSPESFSVQKDMNLNSHASNDYCKVSQKTIINGIRSNELVDRDQKVSGTEKKDKFSDWCKKRQEEFLYKSRSELSLESSANNRNSVKRLRPKSKSPELETRKALSVVNARRSQKFSKSMTQLDICKDVVKTQVCIKIMNERKEKNQELTVDLSDLTRVKKCFPKLKEVLPEVDAGNKSVQFSLEAFIFVLRFAFFRRYSKDTMPSPTVGVEILAAVKTWEINELQNLFLEDFLQKILPASNLNLVFSQASHYGLNDVCEFCKEMAVDGISVLHPTYQRKPKLCFITISTYIEPLEFPIPFYPIHEDFGLSFERHICNTILVKALSCSLTFIGFHVELNGNYLVKCSNLNNLVIDYTAKNISESREMDTGRCEKPLRQVNVIYFRKPLVVNPKQTVEVVVEIDTKPFLCSAFPKDKELLKEGKDGAFHLRIDSDCKLAKSGHNVCMVGKLLYHVQELPTIKIK